MSVESHCMLLVMQTLVQERVLVKSIFHKEKLLKMVPWLVMGQCG